MKNNNNLEDTISRKEAMSKLGNYGKYAALTALGTYLVLNPQKAQAVSAFIILLAFPNPL